MAPTPPTKALADGLVAVEKIVTAKVVWAAEPNGAWRLRTKVLAVKSQEILWLHGYIGRRNHSFVLLYHNYPIRKYTKHFRHPVGDLVFREPHKHTWDEEIGDRNAYIPDDIDPESDINDQFLDFCSECNIQLLGGYQSVAHKM